jgi:hypothetical protein
MSPTRARVDSFCRRFGLEVPILLAPMAGAFHTHYRRHMEVIERAVNEAASERMRGRILDIGTALEIEDQNERSRAFMRQQVAELIESNGLRWSARDAMRFLELDAQLGEQRSAVLIEEIMNEARAFNVAVKAVVPQSMWQDIVDELRPTDGNKRARRSLAPTRGLGMGRKLGGLTGLLSSSLVMALPQQQRHFRHVSLMEKPSNGLEPLTPSLPWKPAVSATFAQNNRNGSTITLRTRRRTARNAPAGQSGGEFGRNLDATDGVR